MALPQFLAETVIPLTNSRGFGKILRFNYLVGSEQHLPLVVSPHMLSMGDPFFTRQAIYFLSDVDCAIRKYSEVEGEPGDGGDEGGVSEIRKAADDCLFEYSLRNPASRLTTRSELPSRRTMRESTEITFKQPGRSDASYREVDNGRVLLTKESRRTFEQLFEALVGDIHDQDLGHQAFGGGADAFPLGLSPDDHETDPVKFTEMPYTFEELDLLSRIVPVDPEMVGKFSILDLLKADRDESSREAIVALLNQPYSERIGRLPPAKFPEPEIIEVGNTYDPRLLDFYFAGLRSLSPVVEFKNYYNIIEYHFEDASLDRIKAELDEIFNKLKEADDLEVFSNLSKRLQPGAEQDQIRRVVQRYIPLDRLRAFFTGEITGTSRSHFEDFNGVVNGKKVQKVRTGNPDLLHLVADRIYTFRNAIIHSKRTFKGKEAMVIRPCSKEEAEIVGHEVLLIKMVAQEIIKQSKPT